MSCYQCEFADGNNREKTISKGGHVAYKVWCNKYTQYKYINNDLTCKKKKGRSEEFILGYNCQVCKSYKAESLNTVLTGVTDSGKNLYKQTIYCNKKRKRVRSGNGHMCPSHSNKKGKEKEVDQKIVKTETITYQEFMEFRDKYCLDGAVI